MDRINFMGKISKDLVKHMSDLAKIPINSKEEEEFADGFSKTIDAVDELFDVDVKGVEPTHQVTGLKNVFREDEVDDARMLSQEAALSGTKNKHDGYFVVPQILAEY